MASSTLLQTGRGLSIGKGGIGTYKATYRVQVDTLMDPAAALIVAQSASPNAVPAYYANYSILGTTDNSVYAQDFDITPTNATNFNLWDVAVTWSALDQANNAASDRTKSPEQRDTLWWVEFIEESVPIINAWNVDALANVNTTVWRAANVLAPIQNAAGDAAEEPVIEEDKVVVLCARKNFLTLAAALTYHQTYNRTVNSDTFQGYTAHKVKFVALELGQAKTELWYNTGTPTVTTYYPGIVKLALRDEPWYVDVTNKGFRELLGSGKRQLITDDHKAPVSSPVNLTATGLALPKDTASNSIRYRTRRAVAYSGLGL